ncbi:MULTISPECIES: hypothetical protein [unclassified Mesorhizobium]|uniref:hypothetical protein n=1 Tax=unclassified Mesorhizobium TaxID=325217 RepID=UPI0016772294|nr:MULTISPECIES: hypothetical protein [unclassified Mesorhizobium]
MELLFHVDKEEREASICRQGGAGMAEQTSPASNKRQQTPLASAMAMLYQKMVSVFY